MKKNDRRPGHVYRLCRKCGLEWNVPATKKYGKKYTCPVCAGKERRKNK